MSDRLLHATTRLEWQAALLDGVYRADSLAAQGFIHCSTDGQIVRVANAYYRNQHGLVLLVIDPDRLVPELRWEPGADQPGELFPHLYGPLNLEAVVRAVDFEPGADGSFALPPDLA